MRLEFRAGMVGASRRYEIRDGVILELERAGTPRSSLEVASVERVRYHEGSAGSFTTRRLELSGHGGRLVVAQVMPAARPVEDPEVAAFLRAGSAMLSAVADANPGVPVEIGPPPWHRWLLFVVMVLGVAGLLLLAAMVLGRRDAAELWWVTAVLGAGAAFATFLAWHGRPWRRTEPVTVDDLLTSLGRPVA